MRKMSSIVLYVLCILLIMIPPVSAQETMWEDGCDPRAFELIAPTTTTFDYQGACDTYVQCDPVREGDLRCQTRALQVLLSSCAADDAVCPKIALLYTAAILAFDYPFGEVSGWTPPQTVIDGVPQALAAASAGDYQAALEAYQMTPRDAYPEDTMMPFSRGVVYELLGDTDAALAEYEAAMDVVFVHPLVWYARSQLYGSLGLLEEASFDAAAFNEFTRTTPESAEFGAALAARYPLDPNVVSDWFLYPVVSSGGGPAGYFYVDLSLNEPQPVRVGIYESGRVLLIGASQLLDWDTDDYDYVQVLTRVAPDSDAASLSYPSYWDNSGSMDVTLYPDAIWGSESISFFEGFGSIRFLLAPAGTPDPRVELIGEHHCEGGGLSRARVGMEVNSPWGIPDQDQIFDAPNGTLLGVPVSPLQIVGGPECVGADIWWQLEDANGVVGWMPELVDSQYTFNISGSDMGTVLYCPAAPAPRLFVGVTGSVVVGLGENNVRSAADTDSELVGTIAEGATFTVTEGPVCADGYVWWNVTSQDLSGWTAEGEGDTYWLMPAS